MTDTDPQPQTAQAQPGGSCLTALQAVHSSFTQLLPSVVRFPILHKRTEAQHWENLTKDVHHCCKWKPNEEDKQDVALCIPGMKPLTSLCQVLKINETKYIRPYFIFLCIHSLVEPLFFFLSLDLSKDFCEDVHTICKLIVYTSIEPSYSESQSAGKTET